MSVKLTFDFRNVSSCWSTSGRTIGYDWLSNRVVRFLWNRKSNRLRKEKSVSRVLSKSWYGCVVFLRSKNSWFNNYFLSALTTGGKSFLKMVFMINMKSRFNTVEASIMTMRMKEILKRTFWLNSQVSEGFRSFISLEKGLQAGWLHGISDYVTALFGLLLKASVLLLLLSRKEVTGDLHDKWCQSMMQWSEQFDCLNLRATG